MKKVTLVLAFGALSASILSGCKSKNKYKTPTTPFDKVNVALSGVQKSFANYKIEERQTSSSKSTRSGKRVSQSDSSGALTEIADLYLSYDSQGDKIDELDYDMPPMVQFNAIKRFFESVGESYSFGTKYTDYISGVVYFDPTTGDKKGEEAKYKYDYNFGVSISLNIDSNDLITGDISFKVDLSQGNTLLQTNWYTCFNLDYTMSKESPTYTLSIFTENLEDDLAYLDYGNTYEYDYVDMKDGRVNEWRKFCYEVNRRMVKDSNHTSFASYAAESGFKCQIGASKWYKNADLRKISHPNTARTNKFAAALFDKFGLNATDINSDAFANKGGVQNTTIKQVYNEFTRTFNQDAVYIVITGNEGHKQQRVKDSMKVMDKEFKEFKESHFTISKDATFREIFNGEEGNYSIWYFDENGEALEQAENLDNLQFMFSIPYGNSQRATYGNAYLDTNISSLYEDLGAKNYDVRLTYALLEITDGSAGLNIIMPVTIDSELLEGVELYFKGIFPYQIEELGFPKYTGENCLFDYKNDIQPFVDISSTSQAELDAFENSLDVGWVKENGSTSVHYRKFVSPTLFDMEIISTNIAEGNIRIVYNKVDWPRNGLKQLSNNIFDFDFPHTENGYFEIDANKVGTITLKNFSETERQSFITMLLSLHEGANIRNNSLFVKKGGHIYQFGLSINEGDIIFDYAYKNELDFEVCELLIEKGNDTVATISLNAELTGYFLKNEFGAGIYKIKKHNLATGDESYLSVSGADLDCYKDNVTFNENTKELEITSQTMLDIRMNFNETSQAELFDLGN